MKRTARIILILLIMLATLLTFVYVGIRQKTSPTDNTLTSDGKATAKTQTSDSTENKITVPDGSIILQIGQSRQCKIQFEDGSPVEKAFWSSGNEKIARVNSKGRVTAVAAGETELLAVVGKDSKTRVKVLVFEDLTSAAVQAVNHLATDGSDPSMELVDSMARSLSHASDNKTADLGAMLSALTAFRAAGVRGDGSASQLWETLTQSVKNTETGLEDNLLRQAALAAYCQGEKSSAEMTITFAGDCTFAYYNESGSGGRFPAVYARSGSLTYPFDLTKGVFGADNVTMINFEGTLTDYTRHKTKQFFFRGDPSYAAILPASSVEAVTVENNHSYDYLDLGYNDTIDNLKKAGVLYTDYYTPAVINVGSLRVVMLSLCLVDTPFSDEFRQHVESYVQRFRQRDTIIIMNVHWGNEKEQTPGKSQIDAAHFMIDAGVDMVIGHHTHVPQGIEVYNGHYIFYSLGNFAFGGNAKASNPETFMLRAMFDRDDAGNAVLSRVSAIPCLTTSSGTAVNNYRPTPLYGENGAKVTDMLLRLSSGIDGGIRSLNWHMIP